MVRITRIRFEHLESPVLGIGEPRPRLSWSFEGDDKDWFQRAYELKVKLDGQDFESYNVQSSEHILVPWPGQPLQSGQQAIVQVRCVVEQGRWTEWSDQAIVEAGLLSSRDWKCSLIESSLSSGKGPHRPVAFRRTFAIDERPTRSRLYITAHGIYSAAINGIAVGNDVLAPGWRSYSHRLQYQTFDNSDLLHPGNNTLEITVAEGWYCGKLGWSHGRYNIYGEQVGLIAMLNYILTDGTSHSVGTDAKWESTFGPYVTAGLYDGVYFDKTQSINEHTEWKLVSVKEVSDCLVAPTGPPVRRKQELRPIDIVQSPSGRTIVDMGQNMVGWIKAKVHGPRGTKVTFRFAEVLEKGEICTRTLRTAKATDTLVLNGDGPIEWEPDFTFHGFRYVEVDGFPGCVTADSISGMVIHSDMRPTGTFSCSNRMLNQLHSNVVWSMRGNFVDIPTDCPQRDERLGWTGDINVFADTANYLFDTHGLLSSWLNDLRLEQSVAGGIVPLVVPNIYEEYTKDAQAIWGDVAIMLPWSLYQAFGDVNVLKEQYESMRTWLAAIPRRRDGLWNYIADWKLADWLDPASPPSDPGLATTDPTHVSDTFLVHVTRLMAHVSSLVGNNEDSKKYTKEAEELNRAYANTHITPSGLLSDNTQTALSLALAFGLHFSQAQTARAAEQLVQLIKRNSRFKIATGFVGTPYIGQALTKTGHTNIFYRMLLSLDCPSWLYPVSMGATTIWERWDSMLPNGDINPGQMTSFNHYALGSVAGWMHDYILGLQVKEPGWKEFIVHPIPGGNLKWAEGEHVSGYGRHSVRWQIKDDTMFWMEVCVPPNTKAYVYLPGEDIVRVVGSGVYTFDTRFTPDPDWPPQAIVAPNVPIGEDELRCFDQALPCPWDR